MADEKMTPKEDDENKPKPDENRDPDEINKLEKECREADEMYKNVSRAYGTAHPRSSMAKRAYDDAQDKLRKAQEKTVGAEIKHLVEDKGMSREQATAAAMEMQRKGELAKD